MFSCEFCEIFKNTYFIEHLKTGAFYIHSGVFTINLKDLITFCDSHNNHARIISQRLPKLFVTSNRSFKNYGSPLGPFVSQVNMTFVSMISKYYQNLNYYQKSRLTIRSEISIRSRIIIRIVDRSRNTVRSPINIRFRNTN